MPQQEQVTSKVAARKLVDRDNYYIDDGNPLPVQIAGQGGGGAVNVNVVADSSSSIDLNNTLEDYTMSPGEVWEGDWNDALGYVTIALLGVSNKNTATNGAKIQFSDDGVNVVKESAATIFGTDYGGGGVYFSLPAEGRYYRVCLVNGPEPNLVTVQSIVKQQADTNAQMPLATTPNDLYTAGLVKAVLAGRRADGTYNQLGVTPNDHLEISISEHAAETPIEAMKSADTNQVSVGTTAVQVGQHGLAAGAQRTISFKSLSANTARIFIGFSPAVTSSNGWPLEAGDSIDLELDDSQDIYAVSTAIDQRLTWLVVGV